MQILLDILRKSMSGFIFIPKWEIEKQSNGREQYRSRIAPQLT